MKDEKLVRKEILNDMNLSRNLPVFFNKCADVNYVHASMEFIINYYNLYEAARDKDIELCEETDKMLNKLNLFIKEYFLFEPKADNGVMLIDNIRNEIIDQMKILTIYSDKFLLYEYILTRMYLSFDEVIEDINQDEVHDVLLNHIFSESDNVIINDRIREVIYNLPIRMTKNKFFDLVKNALFLYIGQNRSTLEDFIYMIKTSAGLQELLNEDDEFEQKLDIFNNADYSSINKEDYDKLLDELNEVTKVLVNKIETYYRLQEIVNPLYAVILNKEYAADKSILFINNLSQIVKSVNESFLENSFDDSVDSEEIFQSMEGKLDDYSEELQNNQMVFSKVKEGSEEVYAEYRRSDLYRVLDSSEKLISSSLFIDFRSKELEGTVDKKYAENKASELNAEFAERLSKQGRTLNRAMIESVIKELPVFFTDRKAVSDYIKSSLGSCHDIAERRAGYMKIVETMAE